MGNIISSLFIFKGNLKKEIILFKKLKTLLS